MPSHPISSKAMGKRPMANPKHHLSIRTTSSRVDTPSELNDDADDWASASGASAGASASSRRVQPARARRGVAAGSLVGTNDVDKRLLETLRRKGECEPLIPPHTNFILTTDASLLPSSSSNNAELNKLAEELYFERPEVMEAVRLQQQVQIPEFRELTDEDKVTGRLRSRYEVTTKEPYGISDAAYEKRHRKHEMFEKKQRMREKEQLQFEHHKLKERIEQLRNMDPIPFLALPADAFTNSEMDNISEKTVSAMSALGLGLNSAAAHAEGERRRHILLNVATLLEERYRTLLPPKFVAPRGTVSVESSEAEMEEGDEDIEEEEQGEQELQPDEDVAMGEEDDDELSSPPSLPPTPAPAKLKPARPSRPPTPDITPSLSRRRRAATPLPLSDVEHSLPREGVFSHDSASARVVLNQSRILTGTHPENHRSPTLTSIPSTSTPTAPLQSFQHDSTPLPPAAAAAGSPTQQVQPMSEDRAERLRQQLPGMDLKPALETFLFTLSESQWQTFLGSLRWHMDNQHTQNTTFLNSAHDTGITASIHQLANFHQTEADESSTTSEDIQPPPYSPVPQLPDHSESPRAFFDQHTAYNFDEEHRIRVKEAGRSDSIVADSLAASRSSIPRTTASIEDSYDYIRRQTSPTTVSSSMILDASLAGEILDKSLHEFLDHEDVVKLASYDIIPGGRGRPKKEIAEIVRASRHNDEPGRRTGRISTKAFGYDPPMGETGPEVEFELPNWLFQSVALLRADDDRKSDGGPILLDPNAKHAYASFRNDDWYWDSGSGFAMEERQSRRRR